MNPVEIVRPWSLETRKNFPMTPQSNAFLVEELQSLTLKIFPDKMSAMDPFMLATTQKSICDGILLASSGLEANGERSIILTMIHNLPWKGNRNLTVKELKEINGSLNIMHHASNRRAVWAYSEEGASAAAGFNLVDNELEKFTGDRNNMSKYFIDTSNFSDGDVAELESTYTTSNGLSYAIPFANITGKLFTI